MPILLKLPKGGADNSAPPTVEEETQLINYTMLYDEGNECSEITGGWDKGGLGTAGSIDKYNNRLTITYTSGGYDYSIASNNAINLAEYSTACAYFNASSQYVTFGFGSARDVADSNFNPKVTTYGGTTLNGLFSIDIGDIEDSRYLLIGRYKSGTVDVYNIFLTKPDDYETLCKLAKVVTPDSLSDLIADTTKLTAIFNSEAAVNFMIKQCTGDFMVSVLNSSDAVAILANSHYLNKIIGNIHWSKFMMIIPNAKSLLNYTMLYDEGNECTDVTSGWSYYTESGYSALTTYEKTNDALHLANSTIGRSGYFKTANSISLSNYSGYYGKGKKLTMSGRGTSSIALLTGAGSTYGTNKGQIFLEESENGIVDISEVSDNVYPTFRAGVFNTAGSVDVYLYNALLFKADNFTDWASIAGITATDLDTLLADSTALTQLFNNADACKYLMGCTGDLMISILNNADAMALFCDSMVYEYAFKHPVWRKFMLMIPTSLSAVKNVSVSIPTMTSNTEPSGVVSADSTNSTTSPYGYPYVAFNKDGGTLAWISKVATINTAWIQYEFNEEIIPFYVEYSLCSGRASSATMKYKFQISTDGENFVDITGELSRTFTGSSSNGSDTSTVTLVLPVNTPKCKYFRVFLSESPYSYGMAELNVYGKPVE